MSHSIHFRLKEIDTRNEKSIHNKLKTIAMLVMTKSVYSKNELIAKESDTHTDMQITSYSQIFQPNHGYKYKLGSSNDWSIDPIDESEHLFLLNYRYGREIEMQKIGHGICSLLDMDYIYNLDLENYVSTEIHPLIDNYVTESIKKKDDIYEKSRSLIQDAMGLLRIQENDLRDSDCRSEVISIMKVLATN